MQIQMIPLTAINVGERLRPVDADYVALIAASMGDRGLDTPIRVTEADDDGMHRLIAGGHRVAAARSLGWAEIAAIPFTGSEMQAELMQIEENLTRHELSALDRAVFLVKWKAIYEALHPDARRGGDRKSKAAKSKRQDFANRSEAFTAAARARLGLSERTVRDAVKWAKALPPDVRAAIAGTNIARKGTELALLARLTDDDRRAVLRVLGERGGMGTVADLLRAAHGTAAPAGTEDRDVWLKRLLAAWKKASKKERAAFLRAIKTDGDAA